MNYREYNSEIQLNIDNIYRYRREDTKKTIRECRKLIKSGQKLNDPYLLGIGYYYLCEKYFSFYDYKKFINHLIKAITYQEKAGHFELLARSYNMLAINAESQGDYVSSLNHYLTALSYCEKCNLKYERGLIFTNLGYLYFSLKDYRSAIRYAKQAVSIFIAEPRDLFCNTNILLNYVVISTCYFFLNNMSSCQKYMAKAETVTQKHSVSEYSKLTHKINQIRFFNYMKEYEKRDALIEEALPHFFTNVNLLDIYHEVFDFCEQLLEYEKFEELCQVIDFLDKMTKNSGIKNIQLIITDLKVQYYNRIGDMEKYQQCTAEYFVLSKELEKVKADSILSTINLRFTLEDIRSKNDQIIRENKELLERSEHDSLTRLPNRYRLNRFGDEALERAFKNNTSLAVEIFDIDNFKQFNDTYGHQAGDECLYKVSQVLHSMMTDHIFCARYGGDEFVVIYEGMNDDQILDFANQIRNSVLDLQIPHEKSPVSPYVTISQGIRNSIPSDGNKLWDYLFAADIALYNVKQNGRNSIRLIHRTSSKPTADQIIQYNIQE